MVIKTTLDKFTEGIKTIRKNGGSVTLEALDSTTEGTAEISGVSAKFEFNQGKLTIQITDKPWLASDSMIEGKIREFFD